VESVKFRQDLMIGSGHKQRMSNVSYGIGVLIYYHTHIHECCVCWAA